MKSIAVLGSLNADLVVQMDRYPNPGETTVAKSFAQFSGGKGANQAVACARLGATVSFVASIGTDPFSEMALGLYRDEGIDTIHVKRTAAAPTGVGFIIVEAASGNNCITIDPGANELLTADDISQCEAPFHSPALKM